MDALRLALQNLFAEVFQGTPPGADGTWFVQGSEALDATLGDLSAEEASRSPGPGISTIAAHTLHASFYLEWAVESFNGINQDRDWAETWRRQTVTEAEWAEAKSGLARHREAFLQILAEPGEFANDDMLAYAVANVAHAAYHLGAIRQLYLLVKASSP